MEMDQHSCGGIPFGDRRPGGRWANTHPPHNDDCYDDTWDCRHTGDPFSLFLSLDLVHHPHHQMDISMRCGNGPSLKVEERISSTQSNKTITARLIVPEEPPLVN